MQHFVYVLESERDGRLYLGVTKGIASRIKRHEGGKVASTKFHRPFRLLGSREFGSFAEARAAEVLLKRFKDSARVRSWISS